MDYEGLKNKLAGVSSQALSTDSNVAAMLAAQAKAMVEARFIMAMHRPRSWDDVRVRLLDECRRPAFAANPSAYYVKPVGKGVEGLGIRFVEVALRCMSNVLVETMTLHDDERARLLRVSVTDLESNETLGKDITVAKTVERSKPLDDGTYISVRTNSSGYKTYTVPATDDDLLNKEGSLVSKAIRTLGLRIIPGDLQDEAEAIILKIRNTKTAADPAAERKNLADSFSKLNVLPSALTEYLGHDFGQCSPAELVTLRGLYGAIKDGETSWAAAIEDAQSSRSSAARAKLKTQLDGKPKLEHGEFPKQREDGSWVDGAGVLFDAAIHGWNAKDSRPSVTDAGMFRSRRGSVQSGSAGSAPIVHRDNPEQPPSLEEIDYRRGSGPDSEEIRIE